MKSSNCVIITSNIHLHGSFEYEFAVFVSNPPVVLYSTKVQPKLHLHPSVSGGSRLGLSPQHQKLNLQIYQSLLQSHFPRRSQPPHSITNSTTKSPHLYHWNIKRKKAFFFHQHSNDGSMKERVQDNPRRWEKWGAWHGRFGWSKTQYRFSLAKYFLSFYWRIEADLLFGKNTAKEAFSQTQAFSDEVRARLCFYKHRARNNSPRWQ